MAQRIVRVVQVIQNDCGWPIWVRIQYSKDGTLLHDAVFMRISKKKIILAEKRISNYIPPKRLGMMYSKAAAVMSQKKAEAGNSIGIIIP